MSPFGWKNGENHKNYIEENEDFADNEKFTDDDAAVTFIEYTVTNNGENLLPIREILPMYMDENRSFHDSIDISYPDNDFIQDSDVNSGESMDIIGSVPTTIYSETKRRFCMELQRICSGSRFPD